MNEPNETTEETTKWGYSVEGPWYRGLKANRTDERTDEQIANYDDACLDLRVSEGQAILWHAIDKDEETGTKVDVDGDRAKQAVFGDLIAIRICNAEYIWADVMVPIRDEDGRKTGNFRKEEWRQYRPSEDE